MADAIVGKDKAPKKESSLVDVEVQNYLTRSISSMITCLLYSARRSEAAV